jgi:hypothetical protein
MRRVYGILSHPSFSKSRPDVVITPGPSRTIAISGPRRCLDAILPALANSGMTLQRAAPATLLVVL